MSTKRKEALKALVRRETRQLIIVCRPAPAVLAKETP